MTILEQSLSPDLNDSEISFLLGVAHDDLLEWRQLLTHDQNVLELRPHFPQVESRVSGLKKKLEADSSL